MLEPATKPWGLSISDTDFEKLKAGLEPEDMEDHWRISVIDQSQDGNISVRISRSWTHTELYALALKPHNSGSGSGSDGGSHHRATIEAITWEQNKGGIRISEEQAKKEVVIITRIRLGCDFETLPEYETSDLWDHPGARKGAN